MYARNRNSYKPHQHLWGKKAIRFFDTREILGIDYLSLIPLKQFLLLGYFSGIFDNRFEESGKDICSN